MTELERRLRAFARAAKTWMVVSSDIDLFVEATMMHVGRALQFSDAARRPFWLGYALLNEVGCLNHTANVRAQSRLWADEWLLAEMIEDLWRQLGLEADAWRGGLQIALTASSIAPDASPLDWLNALLADDATRALLRINNFEQTLWFNQQGAEQLMLLLRETEAFEGAVWPLDALEAAMENAGFRVVRWMELLREAPVASPQPL